MKENKMDGKCSMNRRDQESWQILIWQHTSEAKRPVGDISVDNWVKLKLSSNTRNRWMRTRTMLMRQDRICEGGN